MDSAPRAQLIRIFSFRRKIIAAIFWVTVIPLTCVQAAERQQNSRGQSAQSSPENTHESGSPASEPSARPDSPSRKDPSPIDSNRGSETSGHSFGPSAPGPSTSNLHLGPGDLLEVSVYNVPELTTKARLGERGDIYLPLIGYAHLDGLTPEEAQELLQKRFADGGFVKDPHVTVYVTEYASQSVTLLGEVMRPGSYSIMGQRRLYNLISVAGGLTDRAGRTVTIDRRDNPDHPITIRLAEGLGQTAESNVPIEPGDTIVVERAGIIYVVGDVQKPSGFLMNNDNLTVLKAIALAGGTGKTAKLNDAKILRKTPQGIQETTIHLKKILQAKSPDLTMQAEDILFIPSSAAKAAAYRGTEAVLQAATALSIVAVHP